MRRISLSVTFLIVAIVGWPHGALSEALMAPDGWRPRSAPTGTMFYDCQAKACGPNSTVSYQKLPDGPLSPSAEFNARAEVANRGLIRH